VTPDRLDEYLLEALALDFREYTFVDYGSGKRRVLLVASSFPFREIIGVEFNPELHKVAEENVKTYYSKRQGCKKILPLCIDALEFQLPETPLVLHFYHPFKSESNILTRVLENIQQSVEEHRRPVWLIYVHHLRDQTAKTFQRFPFLKKKTEIIFIDSWWSTVINTNGR